MALDFLTGQQLTSTGGGPFLSTLQTGTGSPMTIAHGLSYTPSKTLFSWQGTGTWTGAASVSIDATNITCTVANTCTFKVLAY